MACFPEYFGNLALGVLKLILVGETSRVEIEETSLKKADLQCSLPEVGGSIPRSLSSVQQPQVSAFILLWPRAPALVTALWIKTHLSPVAWDAQGLAPRWFLFCVCLFESSIIPCKAKVTVTSSA